MKPLKVEVAGVFNPSSLSGELGGQCGYPVLHLHPKAVTPQHRTDAVCFVGTSAIHPLGPQGALLGAGK